MPDGISLDLAVSVHRIRKARPMRIKVLECFDITKSGTDGRATAGPEQLQLWHEDSSNLGSNTRRNTRSSSSQASIMSEVSVILSRAVKRRHSNFAERTNQGGGTLDPADLADVKPTLLCETSHSASEGNDANASKMQRAVAQQQSSNISTLSL